MAGTLVLALALAGCGGGGHGSAGAAAAGARSTTPQQAAPRPHPVPPALSRLRRSLAGAFKRAGAEAGAEVYELGTHATLFALHPYTRRLPASVEKLYTTVALLRKLGPNARLHTLVLGTGHLGRRGTWHGTLYLRGGGDPTFGDGLFNRVWEQGYGPTAAQLAHQLRARGIRRVTGTLIGDASLFDGRPGGPASAFAPDIPDFGGQLSALTFDHGAASGSLTPGAFAARQLARTLRAQHVRVKAAPLTGVAPRDARRLAIVSSPPLSILLKLMDVPSDDLFAEMLTKQLGVRFGATGSTAAGAGVIASVIHRYGVHPRIVDGSGLSRQDRSSPAEVVTLLRRLWRTETGSVLLSSLPVVGISGTTRRIGIRTPAEGRCVAKTGTLNGITNLAGYCAARGRHEVAFALFVDGPPNSRALGMLGRMVAAIARY